MQAEENSHLLVQISHSDAFNTFAQASEKHLCHMLQPEVTKTAHCLFQHSLRHVYKV